MFILYIFRFPFPRGTQMLRSVASSRIPRLEEGHGSLEIGGGFIADCL